MPDGVLLPRGADHLRPAHQQPLARQHVLPNPGTRNPKPETRNPKPETRNPVIETRNPQTRFFARPARNPKTRGFDYSTPRPEIRCGIYSVAMPCQPGTFQPALSQASSSSCLPCGDNLVTGTRNLIPEARNPKPETPKSDTLHPQPSTRNPATGDHTYQGYYCPSYNTSVQELCPAGHFCLPSLGPAVRPLHPEIRNLEPEV